MNINIIQDLNINNLESKLSLINGKLPLLKTEDLLKIPPMELRIFCHKKAYYQLPSYELIEFLKQNILPEDTIEIGAGSGNIGYHLGIKMTDSYQQEEPQYKFLYEKMGQPIVNYGKDVEKIEALEAIKKYKPKIVLGCWVTHKYNANYHHLGGNEVGIDEIQFSKLGVKKYIFIGNKDTHLSKIILNQKAYRDIQIFQSRIIVSRAANQHNNFVAIINF